MAKVGSDHLLRRDSHLPLLRNLLAERFKLTVGFRDEMLTIAVLTRISGDRIGPKLRPLAVDCQRPLTADATAAGAEQPSTKPCSARLINGRFRATVSPISELALHLSLLAERPVADATGLVGAFEVETEFDPSTFFTNWRASRSTEHLPSFANALRDDLGLRIDNQRRLVPMLLVERVEEPTPD
jgi:uncharacterized protein (TIGR03435 family)